MRVTAEVWSALPITGATQPECLASAQPGPASAATSNGNTGVSGTGGNYGVKGDSANNYGVFGTGGYAGVFGTGAYGTYGSGNSAGAIGTSGPGYGLYGLGSIGCVGIGDGNGYGVWGYNADSGGYGVVGQGGYRGLYASGGNAGVYGTSGYVGVWGNASTTSGLNFGIYAYSGSPGGYAGVFSGAVQVSGFLSKLGGGFLIDHPLDPEHKWLRHSFVESPDMMNVYNGNVTTNSSGVAVVKLPAYFTALNRDFRYQLTVIGKMAQAIVDQKVATQAGTICEAGRSRIGGRSGRQSLTLSCIRTRRTAAGAQAEPGWLEILLYRYAGGPAAGAQIFLRRLRSACSCSSLRRSSCSAASSTSPSSSAPIRRSRCSAGSISSWLSRRAA